MLPHELPIPPGALAVWTIYERPSDYPHGYVLRPMFTMPGGKMVISERAWGCKRVKPLRTAMQLMGLCCLERNQDDDPVILETWI